MILPSEACHSDMHGIVQTLRKVSGILIMFPDSEVYQKPG